MSGLSIGVSALITVSAICNIRAEYLGPRWHVYLCKPLTTSLIILLALMAIPFVEPVYGSLVVLGLLLSLAGDIFLMLPEDRFLPGLISFLIAHLLYIGAFLSRSGFHLTPIVLIPYLIYAGVMLSFLWPHLAQMRIPVLVYMIVILVMGWQATEQWHLLRSRSAALAAFGATLFLVSDSMLALNRFRARFVGAQAAVLGTYFTAQWLIALSVAA